MLTALGWSWQKPERRAVERNEAAIARWKNTVDFVQPISLVVRAPWRLRAPAHCFLSFATVVDAPRSGGVLGGPLGFSYTLPRGPVDHRRAPVPGGAASPAVAR